MIDVETYAAAKRYTDTHGDGDGDMKKSAYDSDLAVSDAGGIGAFVSNAISGKVDKVEGKGLSTNDYEDTEKEKVADNTAAIEAIVNVTGAKNVLPFDLHTIKAQNDGGTWSGNSYTYNGITFQFQLNSKEQLVGIDVSGTASAFVGVQLINIASKNVFLESGEKYILSGIPSGLSGIRMTFATNYGGIWTTQATDEGLGDDFVAPTSIYSYDGCTIQIDSGTAISGTITIKPMIRPAGTDATYVPYSMTNRELTDRVASVPHMIHGTYTSDNTYGAISVPYDTTKYNPTTAVAFIEGGFADSPYHLMFAEISGGYLVFAVRDSVGNPQLNTTVAAVIFYY